MSKPSVLTVSMARCLREMKKHGCAERVEGERPELWKWQINGCNTPPQQIDKGLIKGLFVVKKSECGVDRVVMTNLGRLYAERAAQLGLANQAEAA